jgi:hypothetical protein
MVKGRSTGSLCSDYFGDGAREHECLDVTER